MINDLHKELFEKVLKYFEPILIKEDISKGRLLHSQDEISYKIYLVSDGALRSFYFVDGKDVTAHFAFRYGIVGAADSIIKGKKSRYCIEALEDSQVFIMNYHKMEVFLENHSELERLARMFSQYLYMDLVERFEGMNFLSAAERYHLLTERYPGIDQKVKLAHIASYLGISQETLSRVRAKK